jgi:DNA-binding GntR family transcriptional regulator
LSSQIRDGRYQVGDELPPIAALADEFQVSHMTVKEALRLLRERGVISTSRGTRARVLTIPQQGEGPLTDQLQAIRERLDSLEKRTTNLESHVSNTSPDRPA